jgi:hypothetical protein
MLSYGVSQTKANNIQNGKYHTWMQDRVRIHKKATETSYSMKTI